MSEEQKGTVKYGKFQMPSKIKFEAETATSTYAKFIAEPFERGFGHTIGNSLRRMMLTSLEAPAVISVHIEGIPHEYMAVEGIVEDMINIILNFKGALLRKLPTEENGGSREARVVTSVLNITQEDLDKRGGNFQVTLGDLIKPGSYDVVNPDHVLFTVTKPMKRQVDMRVAIGRGYVPSERHTISDKLMNEIIVDSAFSPVTMVNYWVEKTRVGQDTDFDRLILEVKTDGRVTPQEALTFAAQIGMKHLEVFEQMKTFALDFEEGEGGKRSDHDEMMEKLCKRIDEIELSVRSTNCLSSAEIGTIAELVIIPERKMLEFRNFGKKSLTEIKEKLETMGLTLGMDLARYGITEENVHEKVAEYREQHATGVEFSGAEED